MKILTVLFRQFYIFDKCTTYPLYDSEYEVPMNWKNGETENGTFAKYLCYCYDRKLRCFTHVAILQPCWALCHSNKTKGWWCWWHWESNLLDITWLWIWRFWRMGVWRRCTRIGRIRSPGATALNTYLMLEKRRFEDDNTFVANPELSFSFTWGGRKNCAAVHRRVKENEPGRNDGAA